MTVQLNPLLVRYNMQDLKHQMIYRKKTMQKTAASTQYVRKCLI